MVDWLAGKRMKGTSSERTSLSTTALDGTGVGGWVELGRTTLGQGADELDVTSLPDKRYYMYLHWVIPDTYVAPRLRLGNSTVDTGSNYSRRTNENGGTDGTKTSQDHMTASPEGSGNDQFIVGYIANRSASEKLALAHTVHRKAAGAAQEPGRGEVVGKWANTSNPLDVIRMYNGDPVSGDYASGSELIILGWDPDDTHTNNFWEELADVTLSSAGDTIDATITSKKYIWIQAYLKNSGNLDNCRIYLGNTTIDTGSNYAFRHSTNGAADGTNASMQGAWFTVTNAAQSVFVNMFIVNNASNEKLIISHANYDGGAGAANAPQRTEMVGKWANTSNQFDKIRLYNNGTGDFDTGSFMKVWGAD